MAELLHEFWEGDGHGQFGPVSAEGDRQRPILSPHVRYVFSIHAASWFEAMRLYTKQAYDEDWIAPDGVADTEYTEAERLEQEAYLRIRPAR